jgi:hypothetical protein
MKTKHASSKEVDRMDEDLLDALLGDVLEPTVKPLFIPPVTVVSPPNVVVSPPNVVVSPPPKLVVSPPKPRFIVEIYTKTTIPFVGRRCYGGYQPPTQEIRIFMLPEKPAEVKYDLNMDRIHLRAKEKRDTRVKKQLKKT